VVLHPRHLFTEVLSKPVVTPVSRDSLNIDSLTKIAVTAEALNP
jgi:hypothetical protein